MSMNTFGARGGVRTLIPFMGADFKSAAYADSATLAFDFIEQLSFWLQPFRQNRL